MKDATPTASYEAVCTHMSVDAMSIRTSLIENCCKWRSCASEQRTTTEEITTTARLVPRHQPAPLGPSMSRGSQCRTSRLDCLTPGSPVLIQHSTVQYLTVLPLCTARVLFLFLFSVSDLVPGSWLLAPGSCSCSTTRYRPMMRYPWSWRLSSDNTITATGFFCPAPWVCLSPPSTGVLLRFTPPPPWAPSLSIPFLSV